MTDTKPVYPHGNLEVLPDGRVSNGRFRARDVAEALAACKGMVSLAAKRLGCAPSTVKKYVERYPIVAQCTKDAREEMLDAAELALWQAVQKGETWAVHFALKTLGRERGYVERHESKLEAHVVTGTIQEWEQRLQAAHTALEGRRQRAIEADFTEVPRADHAPAS